MSQTLISILIDTYNHERFIEQAITSVLEQDISATELEIVVVDDGSTDRTPEIVRGFEPRVRLLRKSNGGQASAFNAGMRGLRGEVVAFLDGDDWWEKGKLRAIMDAFRENPGIGAIGNGLYEVDGAGCRRFINVPDREYRVHFQTMEEGVWFRELMSFLGTSRLAIRRSVLDRILPVPNELVVEADEYLAAMAVAVSGAVVLDRPLTNYRLHEANHYQSNSLDRGKLRRKAAALTFLARELPVRLAAAGVSRDVLDATFSPRWVEAERLRLAVEGGMTWETFRVEREAYRTTYESFSTGYAIFLAVVFALCLIIPPKWFYRLRSWYSAGDFRHYRSAIGTANPSRTLVERRAAG